MTSRNVLQVQDLCAGYGRVPVLHSVSLDVAAGEMVTLIGANGAGKSTLLKTLAGLIYPVSGRVFLNGRDVTHMTPERLVKKGLALVPEGRMLFGPMTVEENLLLGAHSRRQGSEISKDLQKMYALFPVLSERMKQAAETLSGGEQQMLAIARALMSHPNVLLLDEPSLGLAPKIISVIFGVLDELRSQGLGILLVEQDARIALRHSDRGHVMRTGEIVISGDSASLLADDSVRQIYLGIPAKTGG